MVRCECCQDSFDRDEVADRIDEEHGLGTYEYKFQWNNFCYDCASQMIEEDDKDLNAYDAALIWASKGKDEDYMFGYTEEELENAL